MSSEIWQFRMIVNLNTKANVFMLLTIYPITCINKFFLFQAAYVLNGNALQKPHPDNLYGCILECHQRTPWVTGAVEPIKITLLSVNFSHIFLVLRDHEVYMYVVYILKWSSAHALGGVSGVASFITTDERLQ